MKEMGYQHCKYVVTKHNDTDNQHIHIAACTVQNLPRHPVVNQWQQKPSTITTEQQQPQVDPLAMIMKGFLVNISNPKAQNIINKFQF